MAELFVWCRNIFLIKSISYMSKNNQSTGFFFKIRILDLVKKIVKLNGGLRYLAGM